MTPQDPSPPPTGDPSPASPSRVAFESLRERTDELELIISGISLVALATFPGWLFARWVAMQVHFEGNRLSIVELVFPMAIGLSYTLAGAFLLHLVARAYWVGLIGLKAVFPHGIRWDRITSIGPLSRDYYRRGVSDLGAAIDGADRFASVVFSVVGLVAISMAWMATLLVGIFIATMLVVYLFDLPERAGNIVLGVIAGGVMLVSLGVMLIEGLWQVAGRVRRELPAGLQRVVRVLLRVQGWYLPQHLILPVQLSLEGNMPRRTFSIMFGFVIMSTVLIGTVQMVLAREFAPFGSYTWLDDTRAEAGQRSAYYENLRGHDDLLLRVPVIPSDLVADAYLRVFLPHLPDRDARVLKERCAGADDSAARRACLAGLWEVRLDTRTADVATFEDAERRDLGMRGLQGYLPLDRLAPGRHEVVVTWNAQGEDKGRNRRREYRIPFWFAPPYQMDLAEPEVATDPADDTSSAAAPPTP